MGTTVAAVILVSSCGASAAHAAQDEYCDLFVDYAHPSHHVNGTVNVEARTACTRPMTSIYVNVELIRTAPSSLKWFGTGVTNYGKPNLKANRAGPCSAAPGSFRGWASTKIVPPPGYRLTGPGTLSMYGPSRNVACGVGIAAPTTESWSIRIPLEPIPDRS